LSQQQTQPSPRPRLTIACENYRPERTATGQLIADLAEGLAPWFDVEVLTAQPKYNGTYRDQPGSEQRSGVQIRRLWSTRFRKESRLGRLANWLSFLGSLLLAITRRRDERTYLFVTNPPVAPWALLLSRARKQRSFVLVHDLYPDLAEAIGAVKTGGLVSRVFDAVNRSCFRRADGIVALGEDMRTRLTSKLGKGAPLHVIPNWADGALIAPAAKSSSEFATDIGLDNRFVFLYAGNLGLFQDLETLVDAVETLPALEVEPALVFVGDGGKRAVLEARARRSDRVFVHDFVPYKRLGDLYAAADVGLIALEPGVEKTNVPSKTYSILAAGKPFIAVCDGSRDLQALADDGCGICVPNQAARVAARMTALLFDPMARQSMGRRAREVFDERFSREAAIARYRDLLYPQEAI
jgi:glycosyltransferase involved in cell wall biosynthesis